MKRLLSVLACATALAFVGGVSLQSAENGRMESQATVTAVHGKAEYQINGGPWMKLHPNVILQPGTVVQTGDDSYVDVAVNGHSSAVRIQQDTTMGIESMFKMGASRDADTETLLDVKDGTVIGNVKKITANSRYEIKTPHGVAGIRGTDFAIEVQRTATGSYTVTFVSITGQVFCAAVINNVTVTKILNGGQEWTPGVGDVNNLPPNELNLFQQYLQAIAAELNPILQGGNPVVKNPVTGLPVGVGTLVPPSSIYSGGTGH